MTSRNKNQTSLKKLFAATVLSAGLAFSFSSANAAPRDRDVRDAKKEVKQEKQDVKQAQKQVRKADTPYERRDARENVRDERRDVKDARKDVREEKRDVRNNNSGNNNSGNWNNNNSGYRTFTGTVTGFNSNGQFQLRVGNQTYDVVSSRQLPRGFGRNDIVRVYGVRSGNNDIVNSNVSILNNR